MLLNAYMRHGNDFVLYYGIVRYHEIWTQYPKLIYFPLYSFEQQFYSAADFRKAFVWSVLNIHEPLICSMIEGVNGTDSKQNILRVFERDLLGNDSFGIYGGKVALQHCDVDYFLGRRCSSTL